MKSFVLTKQIWIELLIDWLIECSDMLSGVPACGTLMVGDDVRDYVLGAQKVGLRQSKKKLFLETF